MKKANMADLMVQAVSFTHAYVAWGYGTKTRSDVVEFIVNRLRSINPDEAGDVLHSVAEAAVDTMSPFGFVSEDISCRGDGCVCYETGGDDGDE